MPDDLPAPLRDLLDMLGPANVADILGLMEPLWSEDVGHLRRAVTDGAEEAIRDTAHKIKGSASTFGFIELAAAAEAIVVGAARRTALAPELASLEAHVEAALRRVRAWVAGLA